MSLEGYEVFDVQPHFAEPPKVRGGFLHDHVDIAMARGILSLRGKHPTHALSHRFLLQTAAEIRELEDFFYDRAGKWQPFWIPSWHQELVPASTLANGSDELEIEPVDYSTRYFQDSATVTRLGNYLFLLHQDGTLWTPRVVDVTDGDPEVLTLGVTASKDWVPSEYILGFLYFVRFASDELELMYEGPGAAQAQIGFQEVIRIAAEDDAGGDPPIDGIAFYDSFESYAVGQDANLNRGYAWLLPWDVSDRVDDRNRVMEDDLQSYADETAVNGTTAQGDGQSGTWFGW